MFIVLIDLCWYDLVNATFNVRIFRRLAPLLFNLSSISYIMAMIYSVILIISADEIIHARPKAHSYVDTGIKLCMPC